jgi:hypothetical protein
MTKLLFSGLAFSALLSADFGATAWRWRRPVSITAPAPVSEFTIDSELYRESTANLDDLRIMRGQSETPYVLLTMTGSHQAMELPAGMLNKAWVPGTGVQVVLDLKGHPEHNRLRIVSPLHNFTEPVRVETSDDARTWALVQSEGLIFDILRDDHAAAEMTVSYPDSTRRYVRLTIPGWTDPKNLQAVWLSAFKETGATRDVIATLTPAVHEEPKAQTTELTLDLGFSGRPFDQISLAVDPGLFSRTVEIAATNDQKHWYPCSGGVISRTAESEGLTLEIPERTERYLKITVFNADSAPLHFGSILLAGVRRVVKFSSSQPGPYFVYVGNPSARQPSYDFAHVLPATAVSAAAQLGPPQPNPLFRLPERPWTDRNPYLLNGALVLAVAAMGFVTLRMMKKIS